MVINGQYNKNICPQRKVKNQKKIRRISYDVIVVGAGLSGLSCAVQCALNNRKVLILEAYPYIGGRTSSFYEQGMHIESGLHRFI